MTCFFLIPGCDFFNNLNQINREYIENPEYRAKIMHDEEERRYKPELEMQKQRLEFEKLISENIAKTNAQGKHVEWGKFDCRNAVKNDNTNANVYEFEKTYYSRMDTKKGF